MNKAKTFFFSGQKSRYGEEKKNKEEKFNIRVSFSLVLNITKLNNNKIKIFVSVGFEHFFFSIVSLDIPV